ncbi:PepSY domain-containing protein [Candidatus Sumerlaeota bacterium]|nr:PepSY domain-containing protein [Candidatus Sumerlaeota bacterium]
MKRQRINWLVLCLILCLAAGPAMLARAEDENEKTVSWNELPTVVQEQMSEYANDVTKIEMEIEKSKTQYEVEFKKDGKKRELEMDADGNVLEEGDDD